jgi:transcriptional regulator with XRE-family HTH domain
MTLAEYVKKVMKEKKLSGAEVERRSEGLISDSYLKDITSGKTKRPSLETLKGLARGLGVSYYDELLRVASGDPLEKGWTPESLADAIQRIVSSEGLTEIVQAGLGKDEETLKRTAKRLKRL